jgi:hypothetical protein
LQPTDLLTQDECQFGMKGERSMQFLFLICSLLMSVSVRAQLESVIQYKGQNGEVVKLNQAVQVTRPVPYQVPDTCYRQVPYQNYECRNETRYRQECRWIPASQNCWTENERICRPVTRTRQECHQGPPQQVCHEIPPREVCEQKPPQQVCHTDPRGQRVCRSAPSGRICHRTGGGRQCDTRPGQSICRNVTYTDQECSNYPRQQCQQIPGRNHCENTPYQEQVCGYETRYRSEPYACTKTEYRDEVFPKTISGSIDVRFITNGVFEEFPLLVKVQALNSKFENFSLNAKLLTSPRSVVVVKEKNIQATELDKEIILSGELVIEVFEAQLVEPIFPESMNEARFDEESEILSVKMNGRLSLEGQIELVIHSRPKFGSDKKVAELKSSYPSSRVRIENGMMIFNLSGLMDHRLAKRNDINLKVVSSILLKGEVLNAPRAPLTRDYLLNLFN